MPTKEPKQPAIKYKASVAEFRLTLPPEMKLVDKKDMIDALTELTRKHIVPRGAQGPNCPKPAAHKARLIVP
jgi:hypothetical protein